MLSIDEIKSNINENTTKKHPDLIYEGGIQTYEDSADYIEFSLKGVVIA